MEKEQKTILIIDDDNEVRELLGEYLRKNDFHTIALPDGAELIQKLSENTIDLVILDIMLPGNDGYELCKIIRTKSDVPIIMLTAVCEDTDKIVGLELGADDYLTKPFNPRELLARIKVNFRRMDNLTQRNEAIASETAFYVFNNWKLDEGRRSLISPDAVELSISTGEYDLLYAFVNHPGRVLSRDFLIDLMKHRDAMPFDRSVDIQVSRLRQKLEINPKEPQIIKTIRNGGYMFTPKVIKKAA